MTACICTYLRSSVVVFDASGHPVAGEERRVLLTVLCQDQLPVAGTQVLWNPHEEDLSSSTALPLLLSLLQRNRILFLLG